MLLVIYVANLYAAFEVAVVRGKSIGAVMGLSAVLPIIGPIIFLSQPIMDAPVGRKRAAAEEGAPGAPGSAARRAPDRRKFRLSPRRGSPRRRRRKPQPQVFARGKFTFNKRFIETKFAGFIGEPKGDAKTFAMEVKTLKAHIAVECIKQSARPKPFWRHPTAR